MICEICNTRQVEKNRKVCSDCRKQAQRKGAPDTPSAPEVGIENTIEHSSIIAENMHYHGKPPHRPVLTECTNDNCPNQNNKVFDWEPTCEKCCAVKP